MGRYLDAIGEVTEEIRAGALSQRPCCVFYASVLRKVHGAAVTARAPVNLWHLWAEPIADRDPWGPVRAAMLSGIGTAVWYPPATGGVGRPLVEHAWHGVQTWDGVPFQSQGHTGLWYAMTATTGIWVDSAEAKWRPGEWGPRVSDPMLWVTRMEGKQNAAVAALRAPAHC